MDSSDVTQPLLADAPDAGEHADVHRTQHLCARCSSELEPQQPGYDFNLKINNLRFILVIVAIVLCVLMFIFSVAEMSTAWRFRSPSILQIFVAIWTDVTITVLALLLHNGRRRKSPGKLGRTSVQVHVLCMLAGTWVVFMIAMLSQNPSACQWRSGGLTCGLFTTVHVLSWFLIFTLFGAAYATYRRAVTIHGAHLVAIPAPPPLIPAWRLSEIADGPEEGAVKI